MSAASRLVRRARTRPALAPADPNPLELDTTVALLEILSGPLDHEIALDAATALVELRLVTAKRRWRWPPLH